MIKMLGWLVMLVGMRVLQSSFEPMPPIEQVPANEPMPPIEQVPANEPMPPIEQVPANQVNSLLERNVERFTLGELPHLTPSGYIDPNSVEPIIQLGSAKQVLKGHTQIPSLMQEVGRKIEQLQRPQPQQMVLPEQPVQIKPVVARKPWAQSLFGAGQQVGSQEAIGSSISLGAQRAFEQQLVLPEQPVQIEPVVPRKPWSKSLFGAGQQVGSQAAVGSSGSLGIERAFGQTLRQASSSQVISPEAAVLATGGALLAQQAVAQQLAAAPQQLGQQTPLGLQQEAQQVEQDLRKLREQEQQLAQAELASLMQSKTSLGRGDNQVATLQEKKLSNLASRLHGDLDQNQIHVVEHEVESFFDQLKEEAYNRFIENTVEAIHALIFGDEHKKKRNVTDQELRDMCNAAYQITVARGKKSSGTSGLVVVPRQTGSMLIRPQKR